ncbi:hypothetical protein HN011_007667 [Eciton burchellii]|nr:hypothetical protein HN011_007667 [Eciton burchellii]
MVSSRKKIFFFLAASFARQLIGDKLQVGCTALDAVDSAYRPFTLARLSEIFVSRDPLASIAIAPSSNASYATTDNREKGQGASKEIVEMEAW